MEELKDLLRLEQVAQPVLAQIPELWLPRQGAPGQLLDRLREEDLSTRTGGEQTRQAVEGRGQVVARRSGVASPACRAMRTRSGPIAPHSSSSSARCPARAAANAAGAVGKAAWTASPTAL